MIIKSWVFEFVSIILLIIFVVLGILIIRSMARVEPLERQETPVISLGRINVTAKRGYTDEAIVSAIYRAEGGRAAVRPYGIKSIRCSSLKMYKLACLQTVEANRKRWIKAGCPGDFIMFLGEKYCPPGDHPLNIHWVGNVKRYLSE